MKNSDTELLNYLEKRQLKYNSWKHKSWTCENGHIRLLCLEAEPKDIHPTFSTLREAIIFDMKRNKK